MSRQSVEKAHQKIQELSWEPQYHEPVSQYGTDYTFHKAQKKDPLKQVLRSYFPMPSGFVVKSGLNIRSTSGDAIPVPVSATDTRTRSPSHASVLMLNIRGPSLAAIAS